MKPLILLAILARNQAPLLPLYLHCLESQGYPKDRIRLWIRTNNNTDNTAAILEAWLQRVGHLYQGWDYDRNDVAVQIDHLGKHDWEPVRFAALNPIRQASLQATLDHGCQAYFVADCDNFIQPWTLEAMVDNLALTPGIQSPLLRCVDPDRTNYSNFHADIDENGWFRACDLYWDLMEGRVAKARVPVVHCTYLVPATAIPSLYYQRREYDGRYDYVLFSESARLAGIAQWIDASRDYGCLTFLEGPELAMRYMGVPV